MNQPSSPFDLAAYLSAGVERIAASALRASISNPREAAFILRFQAHAKQARKRREAHAQRGQNVPPFLIASIASTCNLFCAGCYARANGACSEQAEQAQLPAARWGELFGEARELGIAFILLAGGEPLMRRDVLEQAAALPEIIFPVFTNGTMANEGYLNLFDRHRNLVPILSIEGGRDKTDARRGKGTYDLLTAAMEDFRRRGIFFGVSVTVTTENIAEVTGDDFIDDLRRRGAKLAFFVEYVPVSAQSQALAPTDRERAVLESRQSALRARYADMMFLSFPGDEKYTGGCLAAGRGFFHISANGSAEPCPFSPFSDLNLREHSLLQALKSPLFRKLEQSGLLLGEHDGGCLLFEHEGEVKAMISD